MKRHPSGRRSGIAVPAFLGLLFAAVLLLGSDGGAVAEALAVLAVVVFVAGGLLEVIGGLLGLRAAKDPARSMGAIVFGLLALIAAVASAALAFNVTNLCACIIPLVYFICALAVRSRG